MPPQVIRRDLDVWVPPERVFCALIADAKLAFWLDSGPDADAGMSYMGVGGKLVTARTYPELRRALQLGIGQERIPTIAHAAQLSSGWVGWIPYGFGSGTAELAKFMRADRVIAFDHASHRISLHGLPDDGPWATDSDEAFDWIERTSAAINELASTKSAESLQPSIQSFPTALPDELINRDSPRPLQTAELNNRAAPRWRHSPDQYRALISQCQDAIAEGLAYQLCLTNRIEVDAPSDLLAAYLELRATMPSHHGGFIRCDDTALLSASPEQFLTVNRRGTVTTRPIKGTRPRGSSSQDDERLKTELISSDKELAENLMIVDLMRNDLSRIATVGSVQVKELFGVEAYGNVFQLVSTVTAQVLPGLDVLDVLERTFPAGSMTGAPKISAMNLLSAFEGRPRGIYSGAFGYLGDDGVADLAMVIRSLVVSPECAYIGTGGGITALSRPDEEVEETFIKAEPLLALLYGPAQEPEDSDGVSAR